jgi:hypothetical protein
VSEPTAAVLSSLAAARPGDHSDRLQRPCAPFPQSTCALDYFRSTPGGEDKSADATAAVAIREYLAPYRLNGSPGTGNTELVPVLGPDEVELVRRMSAQLI